MSLWHCLLDESRDRDNEAVFSLAVWVSCGWNHYIFSCFGKSICVGVEFRQMLFYIPLLGEDDHRLSVFVGDFDVVSLF